MDSRAIRPYPPTAVRFNGSAFPAALNNAAAVSVVWKRRNRLNPAILFQSEADETPEDGTEYVVLHEGVEENLGTGTNGSFRFVADGSHTVEVFARRGGLDSTHVVFQTNVTGSPVAPGAPPDAPLALTASPGIAVNTMGWAAPAGGPAVTGYTIFGLNGPGTFADAVALGSTTSLTFTHRGAAGGVLWRYWVVAYNGSGSSVPSNESSATAFGEGAGSGSTGVGEPTAPGEEGETYTDISTQPPTEWVYVGGQWMRQNSYDVAFSWPSQVPGFRTFLRFGAVRDFILPVGLSGSQFSNDIAPTQTVTLTLRKNGVDIGTVTWTTGQHEGTAVFTNAVEFAKDDDLELYAPLDVWGMAGLFITLAGSR